MVQNTNIYNLMAGPVKESRPQTEHNFFFLFFTPTYNYKIAQKHPTPMRYTYK